MPKQLKVALAAAVLLVLFMSTQGTAALWRAQGSIDAGSLKTGNLHLLAGNGAKAEENYTFAELDGSNLVPGEFTQAPLTITNGGTTDLAYKLVGAAASEENADPADLALASSSGLSVYTGMSSAECSANKPLTGTKLYVGSLATDAAFSAERILTSGGNGLDSEVLCLRVDVRSDAPQTASGGSLHLVLTFQGQQR